MLMPGEAALLAERRAFLDTVAGLSDDDFEHGPTLCTGWAPRDVLAHVVGADRLGPYVRALGRIGRGNAAVVQNGRGRSRDELLTAAGRWAHWPSPNARATALLLIGDVAVHHQDVLRGLGRQREVPDAAADAILREGVLIGGWRRLLTHRIEPVDGGPRLRLGRGRPVRGTREALGMWLGGRDEVAPELEFG